MSIERVITVGLVAGAISIVLFVIGQKRAGTLSWRGSIRPLLGMGAALVVGGAALLEPWVGFLLIPVAALAGGIYLLRAHGTQPMLRLAGWALIVAAVAGFAWRAMRFTLID